MIEWIMKLIARYRSTEFRKFYHKDGFSDDTEYIEWYKGVATCVSMLGVRHKTKLTLDFLEKCVARGVYEERT